MATLKPTTKRTSSTKKPNSVPKNLNALSPAERAIIDRFRGIQPDGSVPSWGTDDTMTPKEREAGKYLGYADCTAGALLEFARNLAKVPCNPANSRLILGALAAEMCEFITKAVKTLPATHTARAAISRSCEALDDLVEISDQWVDNDLGGASTRKVQASQRAVAEMALDAARGLYEAQVAVGSGGCEFLADHEVGVQAHAAEDAGSSHEQRGEI